MTEERQQPRFWQKEERLGWAKANKGEPA